MLENCIRERKYIYVNMHSFPPWNRACPKLEVPFIMLLFFFPQMGVEQKVCLVIINSDIYLTTNNTSQDMLEVCQHGPLDRIKVQASVDSILPFNCMNYWSKKLRVGQMSWTFLLKELIKFFAPHFWQLKFLWITVSQSTYSSFRMF